MADKGFLKKTAEDMVAFGKELDLYSAPDMAGALRRTAEFIGKQTAGNLIGDLDTGATVDRYVADQIIPFASISEGWTAYRIPRMSDHIEARLWLAEELLGARTEMKGNLIRIKGIGYKK